MIWSKSKVAIVYVATDAELLSEHYYQRLWLAVRNQPLHRREWLDELSDTFRDSDPRVALQMRSGEPFELPEIDDVFPDMDMRWLSDYLRADPSGQKPKIRSPKLDRLRLLDLYYRVKHPSIAEHFYR
tara:strand:- start:880 stop:1263 length:384 start_codon:yes stop_codon:yes gene_type:complete